MLKSIIIKLKRMSKNVVIKTTQNEECKKMCQKLIDLNGMSADKLLDITGQTDVFPVDVAQICFKLGIRLMPFNFKPIEQHESIKEEVEKKGNILGAVVVNDDDLAILYRQEDVSNRRRFTIAHELGHTCLHMKSNEQSHIEFRTDTCSTEPKEIEANIFAGQLLIPEKTLNQLIDSNKFISEKVLPHLSELFMVSENVMRARLDYLKIKILS